MTILLLVIIMIYFNLANADSCYEHNECISNVCYYNECIDLQLDTNVGYLYFSNKQYVELIPSTIICRDPDACPLNHICFDQWCYFVMELDCVTDNECSDSVCINHRCQN